MHQIMRDDAAASPDLRTIVTKAPRNALSAP